MTGVLKTMSGPLTSSTSTRTVTLKVNSAIQVTAILMDVPDDFIPGIPGLEGGTDQHHCHDRNRGPRP